MKTILSALVVTLTTAGLTIGAISAGETSVSDDIAAFQGYFKKQFPEVSLEAYKDGVNALPQSAHRLANWEIIMEFPPFEVEMEQAR